MIRYLKFWHVDEGLPYLDDGVVGDVEGGELVERSERQVGQRRDVVVTGHITVRYSVLLIVFRFLMSLLIEGLAVMCVKSYSICFLAQNSI